MGKELVLRRLVGHAHNPRELAGAERGWDGDLPHAAAHRILVGPKHVLAHVAVEPGHGAHVSVEAEVDRLGTVGDRASSDGDEQVGACLPGRGGGGEDVLSRGVTAHAAPGACVVGAERSLALGNLVGAASQRLRSDDERSGSTECGHLLGER